MDILGITLVLAGIAGVIMLVRRTSSGRRGDNGGADIAAPDSGGGRGDAGHEGWGGSDDGDGGFDADSGGDAAGGGDSGAGGDGGGDGGGGGGD